MKNKNPTNKKELEKEESIQHEKFDSVTNSVSVENQNQYHNTRKVSLGPNTKR